MIVKNEAYYDTMAGVECWLAIYILILKKKKIC